MAKANSKSKKTKMPVEGILTVNASTQPQATIARDTKESDERERKYRAKSALEDIERAEEHKRDKALMKDVKACARDKMKAYGKL